MIPHFPAHVKQWAKCQLRAKSFPIAAAAELIEDHVNQYGLRSASVELKREVLYLPLM